MFAPIILSCTFLYGCPQETSNPRADLEPRMGLALSGASSSVDFSYCVERSSDGRSYAFNRGASAMEASHESASTSKLVAAVIILRVADAFPAHLSLESHPYELLGSAVWTIPDTDPLYEITLADLLSFTSGLSADPGGGPYYTMAGEVQAVANANAGNGSVPGAQFFYSSNHLQVAGLMAVRARDAAAQAAGAAAGTFSTWQDLFAEFQSRTGIFPTGAFDLPPATPNNPRLAGGMHWTGAEYMGFLRALSKGQLLGASMTAEMLADHTPAASVDMAYSPVMEGLGEDWHYGFGLWQEYAGAPYAGTAGTRVSCPGAYGAYPFWDRAHGYFGIVARQGALGAFPEGVLIERTVRTLAEEWVSLP